MTLEDLTKYAEEKYQIQEEHKWAGFPGFSILSDPVTGKWAALLMRQWDTESGTEIQRCDIKCGQQILGNPEMPYLTKPLRMHGPKWVGVIMDEDTDARTVFGLLDRAVSSGEQRGYTMVLDAIPADVGDVWRDTPLPFAKRLAVDQEEPVPKQIRLMRTMYTYGDGSFQEKCRNFYLQGKFMQDYEDDAPWSGEFFRYFPTYHDLSVRQLRGYFSWRTHVRRGDYRPIAASVAYLYLYELLNGIGVSAPEDVLLKMKAFETGFLDAGYGDSTMRRNIRRWMLEYAILNNLPPDTVKSCADADMLKRDHAMLVLLHPDENSDETVFQALCTASGKPTLVTPVMKNCREKGKHLFSEAWRRALVQEKQRTGRDLFSACFGKRSMFPWHPLANTIFYHHGKPATTHYVLSECREYRQQAGSWYVEAYDRLTFDRKLFMGFLRETDLKLRRYLRTGSYLKEKPEDTWADSYIDKVIEADIETEREAARPKIVLDLSGLDRIRRDAAATRDSLLTEEDMPEADEEPAKEVQEEDGQDIPLDSLQARILRLVLSGGDVPAMIRANHLIPSVVADGINEAMFEAFGDTILVCDDDRLSLVEDYREDLEQFLGGTGR